MLDSTLRNQTKITVTRIEQGDCSVKWCLSSVWFDLSRHWPDGSQGPGGLSPAARLPVHHLHPGCHQKRPPQTHHPARAANTQQRHHCHSAGDHWSPGRQLTSVPERNPADSAALWCGAILSLTGYHSRGFPGRRTVSASACNCVVWQGFTLMRNEQQNSLHIETMILH